MSFKVTLSFILTTLFCASPLFASTVEILNTQDGPVTVKNYSYQLQGPPAVSGELLPGPLATTPHDLLVTDFARYGDEGSKFTPTEVTQIKNSDPALGGDGHRKVVVAYVSIGEASDFRSYWDTAWTSNGLASGADTASAPSWLGPVNPSFPESRKVRYWEAGWQSLITNPGRTGWLDQVVDQGFDGVYLDIVDAYYYWFQQGEKTEIEAAQDMIDFIAAIATSARAVNPNFIVIPQNAPFIMADLNGTDPTRITAYLNAINAIGVEDTYFFGNLDEDNVYNPQNLSIAILKSDFRDNGIPVFAVDYLTDSAKIAQFYSETTADGFYPFVAKTRALDDLGSPGPSAELQNNKVMPIKIDQFGYRPSDHKIAFISDPQTGFNQADAYVPAANYEVRSAIDDSVVLTGTVTPWNSGNTHGQSGDKVSTFDFSGVTTPGTFYIYDTTNDLSSYPFDVREDVYSDVLKQAMRSYYYQRFNEAKISPQYTQAAWADASNFDGVGQGVDTHELDSSNTGVDDPATAKDVRYGWFDAGDFNKFVNNADGPIHDFLIAYQQNLDAWPDQSGIPESGNGIPDILDELKVELDWLLLMQVNSSDTSKPNYTNADVGSVIHKVSVLGFTGVSMVPSTDVSAHRYSLASSSATISAAGAYAHAATVYKLQSDAVSKAYAITLENAAVDAWSWLLTNPAYTTFDNTGYPHNDAEDGTTSQKANKLRAAIYLFALTGDAQYNTYVMDNIADGSLLDDKVGGPLVNQKDNAYFDSYSVRTETTHAQLFYAHLPGADAATAALIIDRYTFAQTNMFVSFAPLLAYQNETDAYQAFVDGYASGSNSTKGHAGNLMLNMNHYGIDSGNATNYQNGAAGYLHYLHGTNPLAQVYLSNMGTYGAENAVPEFYHLWFGEGSDWQNITTSLYGPAPGFLVGGPHAGYPNTSLGQPSNITVDGLADDGTNKFSVQPDQKSYRSWSDISDSSYEVTENSIEYQSPYIRLLANFVPKADQDGDTLSDAIESQIGTNLYNVDSDGDGLTDFIEVNQDADPSSYQQGIDYDPNNPDTDGDGASDGAEVIAGTDPLDIQSTPVVAAPLMNRSALFVLLIMMSMSGLYYLRRI